MNTSPEDKRSSIHPGLPIFCLGALSLVYYALYFNAGFNYSDEGNFAQFSYELSLGTSLNDLPVSYGLLWFKVGEMLFHVFGPDLLIARAFFFVCAIATTFLVYGSIAAVTGRRWFAAAFAVVPAIAPAFLPTVFYGLCVLINTLPQIRLAQRLERASLGDAALAGAALALSFQIRPDFGYIFAVPLSAVLLIAIRRGARGLVVGVAAGFVLAQIPGLVLAFNDGYLSTLFRQYLSYPAMLADYGISGFRHLIGVAADSSASSTLLARPQLFGTADFTEIRNALMGYLPLLILIAYLTYNWILLRHEEDRSARVGLILVLFTAGVAAFPHYFFYRPDLSHIANFMPGFVVLAGSFFWQSMPRRGVLLAIPVVISATLALYLWAALTTEGSGSIAGSFVRTEEFHGANGVDVRVSPGEKELLDGLKAVIEANSAPGAAIVCVPYCPGFAFMTGRRLLFREQYVDDALPGRDPQWIPRAIALTREQRPPVVIVMDWAINGTDISRFSRWASPYMETLETLARQKIERPGLSIYLL